MSYERPLFWDTGDARCTRWRMTVTFFGKIYPDFFYRLIDKAKRFTDFRVPGCAKSKHDSELGCILYE